MTLRRENMSSEQEVLMEVSSETLRPSLIMSTSNTNCEPKIGSRSRRKGSRTLLDMKCATKLGVPLFFMRTKSDDQMLVL